MALNQVDAFSEYCPSCGKKVERLNPFTGWCSDCSIGETTLAECERCGKEFTPYQSSRTKCNLCRETEWLERNADAIDRYLAQGLTVVKAVGKVQDDNRPTCAMCGDTIKYGTKGRTYFCSKNDDCRRAGVRYGNYIRRNKMIHDDALRKALGKHKNGNDGKTSETDSSGILE